MYKYLGVSSFESTDFGVGRNDNQSVDAVPAPEQIFECGMVKMFNTQGAELTLRCTKRFYSHELLMAHRGICEYHRGKNCIKFFECKNKSSINS